MNETLRTKIIATLASLLEKGEPSDLELLLLSARLHEIAVGIERHADWTNAILIEGVEHYREIEELLES